MDEQRSVDTNNADTQPVLEPQPTNTEKERLAQIGWPIATLIIYLIMIAVNAMANIFKFNGLTTGDVSEKYPNLFTPAGITFSIWGVIYLLLAGFVVYQFFKPADQAEADRRRKTQIWFIISSLANTAWVFAWHFLNIPLSLGLMLVILLALIIINRPVSDSVALRESFFLRLPFRVYFGWITVATVANITVLLVDLNWDGFGLGPAFWTTVVLIVSTIIVIAVIAKNRDWVYGLVVVWAFIGILMRHVNTESGHGGQYIIVMITVSICLGLIAATSFLALIGRSVKFVSRPKPETNQEQ